MIYERTAETHARRLWRITLAFGMLFCVFIASVSVAIYFNGQITAGIAGDAKNFHIPQIADMKSSDFSLRDGPYFTAMIPFFHFVAAKFIPDNFLPPDATFDFPLLALAVLLGAVSFTIARSLSVEKISQGTVTAFHGALVVACLLFSYYVFLPFAVYNTDTLALVMLMVSFWAYYNRRYLTASISLMLAVLTKSIYLGAVAFPFLLALVQVIRDRRISRESLLISATGVPAVFCVFLAFLYWGGLIPPGMGRDLNRGGFHPYGLLHFFSYFAFICVIFLSARFWFEFKAFSTRRHWIVLLSTLAIIAVVWYFSSSYYSVKEGRFGSIIWRMSGYWQSGDRSVIVLLMSLLGGTMLIKLARVLRNDTFAFSLFLVMCVYGFSLSFTHAAYQRYLEPFTIMCLVFLFFLSDVFAEKSSSGLMKCAFLLFNIGLVGRAFHLN